MTVAVPVQVTFRDMPHSDAVTAHVEKRASKLSTFSERIMRCHVVLEAPHRHHRHGKRYRVRIGMHVPGRELVVSKNLEEMKEDLHSAVDDAFGDAERMLEEHENAIQNSKPHLRPPHGIVAKIFVDRGYGFLEDGEGKEIYFHRNSVVDGRFERIIVGTKVRFAEEDGDKGPQASTVHVID